jgi:hypothetical protein
MPYVVTHLWELDSIEVTLSGVITGADLRKATTEGISLLRLTGFTKALIYLDGYDVAASLMDIYDLSAKQYAQEGLPQESRIAVILPTSASGQQAALDYETFCQNRGWNVQVCPDRQTAIAWLRGTGSR